MIYIECTYCRQKIYTLEFKYCPYCHTNIRMEIYRIKKIQIIYNKNKKIQEKEKDKLDNWDKDKSEIWNKDFLYKVYQEKKHLENKEPIRNITNIVIIAIGLMIVAILFPIVLGLIGNGKRELAPLITTILTVLLPIVLIIAVILFWYPINNEVN